jgi:hypothetical protein
MEITIPPWIVDTVVWAANLFTPGEWKAIVLLVGVTLAATHTVKLAWRLSPLRGGDRAEVLWLISALLAILFAPSVWPAESVHWFVAGVIAGPLSNITFAIAFGLLRRFAPNAARTVNFDRRRARRGNHPYHPKRKEDQCPLSPR